MEDIIGFLFPDNCISHYLQNYKGRINVVKSLLLFISAGTCEIGGAYLI
jgi:hypothetical protein